MGDVPMGDVRLTVNIRKDAWEKLKTVARVRRTTMSVLIESFIEALPFGPNAKCDVELPVNQSKRKPGVPRLRVMRIEAGHKADD